MVCQFMACHNDGQINEKIELFYNKYLPDMTEEQVQLIVDVVKNLSSDKKMIYLMAMNYFEDKEI